MSSQGYRMIQLELSFLVAIELSFRCIVFVSPQLPVSCMLVRLTPKCFISLAATTEPHGCDRYVLKSGEEIGKKVIQAASHFF